MCRVLRVSRSGYYAWRSRPPSARHQADEALRARIGLLHAASRQHAGSPTLHQALRQEGIRVGRKRVARLMREANLVGTHRRRRRRPTRRMRPERPAPDLVGRVFCAKQPDTLWIADITQIPTQVGTGFLAVVLDVFSRRVVGWALEHRETSDLVSSALTQAAAHRSATGVIHPSDQGAQYTSASFLQVCREREICVSMGSVGDCYDDAMCESFFATLKCELVARCSWPDRAAAHRALFTYIDGYYNTRRLHSALGYRSPVEYERMHARRLR